MKGLSCLNFDDSKIVQPKHMASEPGRPPQFWTIGPFTLRGDDAHVFRSELFSKLGKLAVHITRVHDWVYRLEYVDGPAYVDIKCYFWSVDEQIVAELHLMSGERFTWHRLWREIVGQPVVHRFSQPIRSTSGPIISYLESGNCGGEILGMVGPDVPDHLMVQFLNSEELNIVLQAISKLNAPIGDKHFQYWVGRRPTNYLETLICGQVCKLMSKNSRM